MRRTIATLIVCAAALSALPLRGAIPAGERTALIALYNATGGPGWTDHAGWVGPAGSECTWFGVRCSADSSAVTGIFLSNDNLTGALPPEIGSFPALTELSLFTNSIGGAIPPQVGNLVQLTRLELYQNRLSGKLPRELGNLKQVTFFGLSSNQLTGAIPAELGNLSSVEYFAISGNLLDGPLPPELGRLPKVQTIDLSYNSISGSIPRELGQLATLVDLSLLGNQLTGAIPPELGNLASLRALTLSINHLTGSIPPDLSRMTELRTLSLGINELTGQIPAAFAGFAKLEILSVPQNALSGAIPPELSHISTLVELSAGSNQLGGAIPRELAGLTNLQRLDFGENKLTGSIPPELGGLSKLLVLALSDNQLSGTLPHELTNLTALVSLSFSSNRISGEIPSDITRLAHLEELVAFENQLSGPIPSDIGSLTKMRLLLLGGNQLTGTIPPSITSLSALTFLDLRGNQLTGVIPADIDQMASLENISVPGNRLSGPIPDAIARLSALAILRLEDNELTGVIPPAIVNLQGLTFLGLRNNHLEGTVPAGIDRLTKLETLWLGGNRLAGAIPAEIGRLTQLGWIDLANNRFAGAVPPELKNLANLTDNLSDFRFNLLFTSDASVRAFLNRKQDGGEWEGTQTLPPSSVATSSITDRSAVVSWNLATYKDDEGGYQVTVSVAGGAPVTIATTSSKLHGSILVRGLSASTTCSVTVRTVTHPHGLQQNTLTSDPTAAASFTTGAAVIAPANVEITLSPAGLVQRGGQAENEDSFTLTNSGDVATAITLTSIGDFFDVAPTAFSLGGGASQTVRVTSRSQAPGAYSGEVLPKGAGVPDGLSVPIHLLSVAAPAGTAIAQAATTRVDLAGARDLNVKASVRFSNSGSGPLTGIAVSDAAWIEPPPGLITIAPGASVEVPFTIVPAKRPAADGALAGSLRLVYLNGSGTGSINALRAVNPSADPGVSISIVTVVYTPSPSTTSSPFPPLAPGEVIRFVPGIVNRVNGASRLISDLFVSNSFGVAGVSDLRVFFSDPRSLITPTAASFGALLPSQAIHLASVVTSVYNSDAPVGTLQLRSAQWARLLVNASLLNVTTNGTLAALLPVFRSDRATGAGDQISLPGLEKSDRRRTDVYLQETTGNPVTATVEILDAAGGRVGDVRSIDLVPNGLAEITDAVAAAGATAIVTNTNGSAGRVVAYARVSDLQSGDTWPVVDWRRFYAFAATDTVTMPVIAGARGSGKRRAVSHNEDAGASAIVASSSKSDITIFNLDAVPSVATVSWFDASGNETARDLNFSARETKRLRDIGVTLFNRRDSGTITVSSERGHFAVSARSYFESTSGSYGSSVPVRALAQGLRLGQQQVFAGIEDSSPATIAASKAGTYRTSLAVVESEGKRATVRASLVHSDGRHVFSTVFVRDYEVQARGLLLVENVIASITGSQREALGDLHDLQLTFDVVAGEGAATIFLLTTENGIGATTIRQE